MERQRSFGFKPSRLLFFSFAFASSFFFSCCVFYSHHSPSDAPPDSDLRLKLTFSLDSSNAERILDHSLRSSTTDDEDDELELEDEDEDEDENSIFEESEKNMSGTGREGKSPGFEGSVGSNGSEIAPAGAKGIEMERSGRCEVWRGRWVYDESYPLYSACPFVDEGFSCVSNGRMDKEFMKWRWQPDGCDSPRFDAVRMLELLRGKRLVFVGDSINRNQWESLLCLLRSGLANPKRMYEARGRRITKQRGNYNFKFPDYQCSVEYYVTHFLVHESKARVGRKRMPTLKIDTIDRGSSRWRGADILVFNTAHWWSHYKTKSGQNYYQEGNHVHPQLDVSTAFRKALLTWASWVDHHVNPGKTQVFFRSSAPSHFRGGEWNSGGHCKENTHPLNETIITKLPEKNTIVEQVINQMRTPVTLLNISALSGLRIDGHPSIYGRNPKQGPPTGIQDCSHWCLPGVPDTWNELLYFHLLSKQKSNFAS